MQHKFPSRFLILALFAYAPLATGSGCDDGPGMVDASKSAPAAASSKFPGSTTDPSQNPASPTQTPDRTTQNTADRGDGPTSSQDGPVECGDVTCPAGNSCVDGTCVDDGVLRISLVWDSDIDLDIHVKTPSGEELYYRNREGSKGGSFMKDGCLADRCPADEPRLETVLWRGDAAPKGMYEVWAVNYDGKESVNFRIDVIHEGSVKDSFSGTLGANAGDRSSAVSVCIGETVDDDDCSQAPDDAAECLKKLDQLGISWEEWGYSTQKANGKQCSVEDPVRVSSNINGVEYKYYNATTGSKMSMACPLAVKLHELSDILKSKGITTALHVGTFNCRTIAGSANLSQHAHGYAIDLWGFVGSNGTRYILEEDWEHDTTNPTTAEGKVLYSIAQEAHAQKVFNTILTPNFNRAHDNHFHVDLKPGANYLGYYVPESYLGNDTEAWEHSCPNH